jgi:dethiobiotin synthetase
MHLLFITGTDTAVGKTHVACVLARQLADQNLRVGIYKPVCSGAEHRSDTSPYWDDIERLAAAVNVPATVDDICPQRFLAPLAPPVAARLEDRRVDFEQAAKGVERWRNRVDVLLIEGAGGWLCPLTESEAIADLAAAIGAPVLIVAPPRLGTINHTLLTVESIRSRGLQIVGVVFCETTPASTDDSSAMNAVEIERRGGVRIFGTIPYGNASELLHDGKPVAVNWRAVMCDK